MGILCKDCDNRIIGGYESYSRNLLYSTNLPEREKLFHYQENGGSIHFQNVSYEKFKLFILSILWRAGVSSRDLFNQIRLGPPKESELRNMIFEGNPGDVDEYPITIYSILNDNSISNDFIMHPIQGRVKSSGARASWFPIGGLIYLIYQKSKDHKIPEDILNHTIRPTNKLSIIPLPKGTGRRLLFKTLGLKR